MRRGVRAGMWTAGVTLLATVLGVDGRAEGSFVEPVTRVALIGDTPYQDYQIEQVDELIREINASRTAFTIHVGDIKTGSSLCSDELLEARYAQLQQLERGLVYTPGDNEWTDCHRRNAGMYEPHERLAKLRSLFFPKPGLTSGRRPFPVLSQAIDPAHREFVENALFIRSNVVFATLHVVGSNNGVALWDGVGETAESPRPDRTEEVERRTAAALAWIDRAFDAAEQRGAAGVVLAMQANPAFERPAGDAQRQGFEEILARITARSVAFARPVVIAHGDSHYYRIDKPLVAPSEAGPRRLEDVTRVETFGDTEVHWVELIVDPSSPELFRFVPHLVEANKYAR